MYRETVEKMITMAVEKYDFCKKHVFHYLVLSMLAGIYIGFGVILSYTLGSGFWEHHSPAQKLVMGLSFGVALSLVSVAGAELFTGNNMIMTMGSLDKKVSWGGTLRIWFFCYLGNLLGAILLALMMFKSGLILKAPLKDFILYSVEAKMNTPFVELFFKGLLCNILVCLATWMSAKCKEETAKLIMIFWCLFAFISSGFEHSIANMTTLTMGLLLEHNEAISIIGFLRNIIPVTLGNIVGGAVFVGGAYFYASTASDKK